MAATQYQVFCRYFNENNNSCLTNRTSIEWISANEYYTSYTFYNSEYDVEISPKEEILVKNENNENVYCIEYYIDDTKASNNEICIIKLDGTDFQDSKGTLSSGTTRLSNRQTYKNCYTRKFKMTTNQKVYECLQWQIDNGVRRYRDFMNDEPNIYTICKNYIDYSEMIRLGKAVLEYAMIRPKDFLSTTESSTSGKKTLNTLTRQALALDNKLYSIVSDETNVSNPKYDMVFMYDGIVETNEQPLDQINDICDQSYYYQSNDASGTRRQVKSEKIKLPVNALNYTDGSEKKDSVSSTAMVDWDKEVPYLYYEKMRRIKLDPWFAISVHQSLNAALAKASKLAKMYGVDNVKIGKIVPLDQYIKIV